MEDNKNQLEQNHLQDNSNNELDNSTNDTKANINQSNNESSNAIVYNDSHILSLIPSIDVVIYPGIAITIFIARDFSINALMKSAGQNNNMALISLQKNNNKKDIQISDIHSIGTLIEIIKISEMPDGVFKVIAKGVARCMIHDISFNEECFTGRYEILKAYNNNSIDAKAMYKITSNKFDEYVKLSKSISHEVHMSIRSIQDFDKFADILSAYVIKNTKTKQIALEELDIYKRMSIICNFLEPEIQLLNVENKIKNTVKEKIEKNQREHYLQEQLKAIQGELGNNFDYNNDILEFEKKLKSLKISKEGYKIATDEINRLKSMNHMSPEASIIRNYLNILFSLPWGKFSNDQYDIKGMSKILDEDSYGMYEIKKMIKEFMISQKRAKNGLGMALCLVGPPGIGKTSLAKSIARSINRPFASISLNGMRDESEIKGHRRTYIGSMPGRLIKSIIKAGVSNPVILLDEIDKMSSDWRGDPSSTLLEVLEPTQSKTFSDYYLDVDYDLSNVIFIATANTLNMPAPLRDRLEIIQLQGYSQMEKLIIAKKHLLKNIFQKYCITKDELSISDNVIQDIIKNYTIESGVRNLSRCIEYIVRRAIYQISSTSKKKINITSSNFKNYISKKLIVHYIRNKNDAVGVTTSLAWTQFGGDILNIESAVFPGKGIITHTGDLGNVMKESFRAAECYIRSNIALYNIDADFFTKNNLHVHAPAGGTPKDGPSAGCSVAISMLSAILNKKVKHNIGITGEITLMGKILPVGGIREKILAAIRYGLDKVILPESNRNDVEVIDKKDIQDIEISYCNNINDAIGHLFYEDIINEDKLNMLMINNHDNIKNNIPHVNNLYQ